MEAETAFSPLSLLSHEGNVGEGQREDLTRPICPLIYSSVVCPAPLLVLVLGWAPWGLTLLAPEILT